MSRKKDGANLATGEAEPRTPGGAVTLAANPREFTRWQRAQISVISWAAYFVLQAIGRTLRFEIEGWEHWEAARKLGRGLIYTSWHNEIFADTWFWRKRGIVVMSGWNFDAEYVARCIQRLGYRVARGSSSRGASRALVEMIRVMKSGGDAGFTIDGPRGPRRLAKPGSVMLAKASGGAILCFHIALRRAFTFRKSWDLAQIPCPFTRAALFIAPPITVSPDADDDAQANALRQVQATLDDLSSKGEAWRTKSQIEKAKG